MNRIFPVPPGVEPVLPESFEGLVPIGPDLSLLDDEPVPEGVTLLLSVLDPSPRLARRPGELSTTGADPHANLADLAGEAMSRRKTAEPPAPPKGAVLVAEGLPVAERDAVQIGGPSREAPVAGVQDVAFDERLPVTADERQTPVEGAQEDSLLRVAGEFPHGIPLARSEAQAPVQAGFEGRVDEQAAMSEQHEEASSESRAQDDDTSDEFLQVPFRNERAQGQVLVSRDEGGESGLLIRTSGRQVFEQLQGHFDQARQPRWRLGEVTGHDGGRSE